MKNVKNAVIKFVIYGVVLAILIGVGAVTKLFELGEMSQIKIAAPTIMSLVIMIFGVIAVSALLELILALPKPESHRVRSLLSIISSLIKYVSFVVILCWGLSIIGVDVSTIVAGVGIVALIVGFSAESLISDVVIGAFMIFENQYNVGDIVEVGSFRGTVTSIGIRTTCITDAGGNVKIINNSSMTNILNRSDNTSKSVIDFGIPYETDLEKLETQIPKLLQEIYDAHEDVMKSKPNYLGVQELADSAVILRFNCEVDESNIFAVARILNHDLFIGFKKLGIEVPFPQLDVHTK